jgi:hypothetical protein
LSLGALISQTADFHLPEAKDTAKHIQTANSRMKQSNTRQVKVFNSPIPTHTHSSLRDFSKLFTINWQQA